LEGGMGAIAQTLVEAVRRNGGQVHFRQEVTRIKLERGRPLAVETKRGDLFPADVIIANLPPWNLQPLLGENRLASLPGGRQVCAICRRAPQDGWGAFVVYTGVDGSIVPDDFPLHHQVVMREPLGEGNTVFLSLSPAWDETRAPRGKRAITLSTHTALDSWWNLHDNDRAAYEARKQVYTARVLEAAEEALPGLRDAAELVLPGTPVSFQRFTRRARGWVGGFPQTNLFRAWSPRLGPNMWMVGDSIFPGQSTAAVALGGLRVANEVLRSAAHEWNSGKILDLELSVALNKTVQEGEYA